MWGGGSGPGRWPRRRMRLAARCKLRVSRQVVLPPPCEGLPAGRRRSCRWRWLVEGAGVHSRERHAGAWRRAGLVGRDVVGRGQAGQGGGPRRQVAAAAARARCMRRCGQGPALQLGLRCRHVQPRWLLLVMQVLLLLVRRSPGRSGHHARRECRCRRGRGAAPFRRGRRHGKRVQRCRKRFGPAHFLGEVQVVSRQLPRLVAVGGGGSSTARLLRMLLSRQLLRRRRILHAQRGAGCLQAPAKTRSRPALPYVRQGRCGAQHYACTGLPASRGSLPIGAPTRAPGQRQSSRERWAAAQQEILHVCKTC